MFLSLHLIIFKNKHISQEFKKKKRFFLIVIIKNYYIPIFIIEIKQYDNIKLIIKLIYL